MKRSSIIVVTAGSCLIIALLTAAYWFHWRYDETLIFAGNLEKNLRKDERFAALQVVPSTAHTVDIMGPVANSNLMVQLKDEVLAFNPPVPTVARLYVGDSNSPAPDDFGKGFTWMITP